jgi:hypothetical protein
MGNTEEAAFLIRNAAGVVVRNASCVPDVRLAMLSADYAEGYLGL